MVFGDGSGCDDISACCCQVFKNSCRAVVERHAHGFDDPLPSVHCHIVHGYEDVTSLAGHTLLSLVCELVAIFLSSWLWLKVMLSKKTQKGDTRKPWHLTLVSPLTTCFLNHLESLLQNSENACDAMIS